MAMSETVNVAEFKDRLSELLSFVERGGHNQRWFSEVAVRGLIA